MKIEMNEEQVKLITNSLYYANCRLGQPRMEGGRHESEARYLIQVFDHQIKQEQTRKE